MNEFLQLLGYFALGALIGYPLGYFVLGSILLSLSRRR